MSLGSGSVMRGGGIFQTEQVLAFEKLVTSKMDTILPQKTVKINPNFDKPSEEIGQAN
jgi:hypothetical protein